MIPVKSAKEIEIMREGGRRLAWVMGKVLRAVKPGASLIRLDQLAEALIEKKGGQPSFKMVKGYRWATCINVNQGVVHGVPNEYRLKNGDLVSLDMGMFYRGLHTDAARTILTSEESFRPPPRWSRSRPPRTVGRAKRSEFLKAGKKALKAAIQTVKPGHRVGHISAAIEKEIKRAGFSPIKTLTGHGVGKKLHEEPQIPCFLKGKIQDTPRLEPGMALAIEVIYVQGKPDLVLKEDGWTMETADGQLAGLLEDTIVVTNKGPLILTRLDESLQI